MKRHLFALVTAALLVTSCGVSTDDAPRDVPENLLLEMKVGCQPPLTGFASCTRTRFSMRMP